MIQIAPSILSADFTKLGADLDAIATADMVHFDVMDGAFVPNISYGMPICKAVNQYTDMFLDTHLMIEKPARYIEDFAKAGADLFSESRSCQTVCRSLHTVLPSDDIAADRGKSAARVLN